MFFDDKYLTFKEVLQYLKIGQTTFWKMRKKLPLNPVIHNGIKSGKKVYLRADVDRWVQEYKKSRYKG